MKFEDFKGKEQELIEKLVLRVQSNIMTERRSINKIIKVTKTAIKIDNEDMVSFDFFGSKKGTRSKMDIGSHDSIKLITEEEAEIIRKEFKEKKELIETRKLLMERLQIRLQDISLAKLKVILKIIEE